MCALGNHEQLDRLVLQQEAGVRLPLLQHRREPNGFEAKRSSHPVKVEARRACTPRREALPKWGGTVDLGGRRLIITKKQGKKQTTPPATKQARVTLR